MHKISGQTQPIRGNPSDGQRERQADRDKQTQRQAHKLRVSRKFAIFCFAKIKWAKHMPETHIIITQRVRNNNRFTETVT